METSLQKIISVEAVKTSKCRVTLESSSLYQMDHKDCGITRSKNSISNGRGDCYVKELKSTQARVHYFELSSR